MAEVRLVVVIPSRGLDALLGLCVQHARAALDRVADRAAGRIVVIDNASEVPYRPVDLPGADRVLRFDAHRSFSAACNAGAAVEPSDLVLLLNNDVLLHDEAVAGMLDLLDEPLVGIVGTRMVFPNGSIQHCGVVFNVHGPYHDRAQTPSRLVPRAPRVVQCVTGAALMIRSEVLAELDGLCEDYPFGYEDVDLCLRARQNGHRILCAQTSDSLHFESLTDGRVGFDVPSRALFLARWGGRWSVDADDVARHA